MNSVISRRALLRGSAAALGASLAMPGFAEENFPGCASPMPCSQGVCKPAPKFDAKIIDRLAGLRPHREGTYRLEAVKTDGKHIVHNYGHGGAGITMSMGCATEVAKYVKDIVTELGDAGTKKGIAVLGAGVMGLTAARAIRLQHPQVTVNIYAEKYYRETTSSVAGGQFAPSSVKWNDHVPAEHQRMGRILASSKEQFIALGKPYGVYERMKNYTLDPGALGKFPTLTPGNPVTRLPFANMNCSGHLYETLLIEPPVFLRRIHNELYNQMPKVQFNKRTFAAAPSETELSPDVKNLDEVIIINCTGLGSRKVFHDCKVSAVKGHLVKLERQANLDYLFSGDDYDDWVQYVFPRSDGVIVGGTYIFDPVHDKPNKEVDSRMLASLSRLFNGLQSHHEEWKARKWDIEQHLPNLPSVACD